MIGTMMMLNNFFYPGLSHFSAFRKLIFVFCVFVFISHFSDFHGVEPRRNVIKTTYDRYGFFSENFEVVM